MFHRPRLFVPRAFVVAVLATIITAGFCSGLNAQDLQGIPALTTRATDITGTLSVDDLSAIERKLAAFEERKGSQIAVLIVSTTKPEEIEQYSIRVAEKWKIGRKKIDDGVILVVALKDRKLRIEVGYGLEGALPDVTCKRIINEQIVPNFKAGRIPDGINAGLDAIIKILDGEQLPPPAASGNSGGSSHFKSSALDGGGKRFGVFLVGLFVAGSVLSGLMNRFFAGALIGGAGLLLGYIFMTVGWGALLGIIAMLTTWFISGRSGGGGGWSSGSWSGGSSGGSSWSGGGGGSFGGGGSSGSW